MVKNTVQCLANDDWNTFFTSTYSRWITCSTSTLSTSSVAITWNTSCAICISYTITLSTSITVRRSTICIGNYTVASYWNISIFVQKTFMAFKASFKIEQNTDLHNLEHSHPLHHCNTLQNRYCTSYPHIRWHNLKYLYHVTYSLVLGSRFSTYSNCQCYHYVGSVLYTCGDHSNPILKKSI